MEVPVSDSQPFASGQTRNKVRGVTQALPHSQWDLGEKAVNCHLSFAHAPRFYDCCFFVAAAAATEFFHSEWVHCHQRFWQGPRDQGQEQGPLGLIDTQVPVPRVTPCRTAW